jgi:putative NADPH-quinone reductase
MKKYLDDVYAYGFAHGTGGDKLKEKKFVLSFTTGSSEDLYNYENVMNHPIKDFLPPLTQTVKLCQMELQELICSTGMQYIPNVYPPETLEMVKAKSKEHAHRFSTVVSENLFLKID